MSEEKGHFACFIPVEEIIKSDGSQHTILQLVDTNFESQELLAKSLQNSGIDIRPVQQNHGTSVSMSGLTRYEEIFGHSNFRSN
jgi:hypothetical protein